MAETNSANLQLLNLSTSKQLHILSQEGWDVLVVASSTYVAQVSGELEGLVSPVGLTVREGQSGPETTMPQPLPFG